MNKIKFPLNGSCQCGNVTYLLKEPPLSIIACHCRECQKLSTSAFSLTAIVKAESVEFNGKMKDWSRDSESGNINAAKFCPTCGNRIYHYNPKDLSIIKLKPTNLSDTSIIKPTIHVWVSEKQEWYEIPVGVTTFEKQFV